MIKEPLKTKSESVVFKKIEESVVILCRNGTYIQTEAWIRKNEIFCRLGSGFIGLKLHNTSVKNVQLIECDLGDSIQIAYTGLGKMVTSSHPDAE